MTKQYRYWRKLFSSYHYSWLFRDVPRTGQLLSADAAMGVFVHCNGHFRCDRRCVLFLWFIQYFGKQIARVRISEELRLLTLIFNFQNMDSFLTLLQLERTSSIYQSMVINANILPLPAVIMMAVAGRGFIFWCLNILCIPVVLSQAKIIVFGKSRKSEANTHRTDTVYERNQADSNTVQEVCNARSLQMCFR